MMKRLISQILIIIALSVLITGCENPEASPVASNSPSPSKTPILPTEYLTNPFNDMVVKADCIAFGNISAQRYEVVTQYNGDKPSKAAYTIFTLSVEKMIKGDPNSKEVFIKVPGGLIADAPGGPIFSGPTGPYFVISDKVLICLHKENNNIYIPEGGPPKKLSPGATFSIDGDSTNGIIWIEGTHQSTGVTLEYAIGLVIQIMRANQIPIALPRDQWPPLPVGPVTPPIK